jgi:hypothetical protein
MTTIQQITIQDLEAESVDVRVSDERGTVPGVRVVDATGTAPATEYFVIPREGDSIDCWLSGRRAGRALTVAELYALPRDLVDELARFASEVAS